MSCIKTTGVKIVIINTKRIGNGSIISIHIVDNECTNASTKPFRSGLRILQHEGFPNESFVHARLWQWSEKARKRELNINRQIPQSTQLTIDIRSHRDA